MRLIRRVPAALLVLVSLVFAAAACGQTPPPASTKTGASVVSATPAASTASPGASGSASIATPWGPILASVPATFPVFPSATPVPTSQAPGGPWSGAWSAPAGATEVTAWYRDQLGSYGFIDVEVRPAASDGTRLIDAIAGSAGCEAQMTIKASGGTTLITVLWGAGCAKLGS